MTTVNGLPDYLQDIINRGNDALTSSATASEPPKGPPTLKATGEDSSGRGAYDLYGYQASGGDSKGLVSRKIVGPGGSVTLYDRDAVDENGNPLTGDPIFIYQGGDGARYWDNYSQETRKRLETQMVQAGVLREGEYSPGGTGTQQYRAWEQVLGWANEWNVTPFNALAEMQATGVGRTSGGGGGGGGGAGPSTAYTIPDYETISQNAKGMLRNTMGRDIEDWEISLVADELQKNYRKQGQQTVAARLAGSGEYEITDPGTVTQAFVEDQYSDELSRIKDVGDEKRNFGLAMASFTQGAKMVGA